MAEVERATGSEERFLNLSARMSRTLGAADDATLGVAVVSVLEDLASWAGADCASVTLVDQADRVSDDWHWFRPELDPVAPAIGAPLAETFGSALEFLKVGHTVAIDDIDALELSPEERRMATRNDLRALVIAPVRIAGVFLGVVGLHVFGRPHVWEPRVVNRVELVAGILVQTVVRTHQRAAVEQANARARRVARLVPSPLLMLDPSGRVTWVSPSYAAATGWRSEQVLGRAVTALFVDDHRGLLAELGTTGRASARLLHADGTWRWTELSWQAIDDRDTVGDRDDETLLELRAQAVHDDLTDLPNWVLLLDCVEQALARRAENGALVGALFVDLDDFKTVNNGLGHAVGDELLRQAAERLRTWCRRDDTVARLGGDEFAVLIESAATVEEVLRICDQLRDALRAPFEVGLRHLTVSACVGVALANTRKLITPQELLRNADAAMCEAKSRGKDQVEVFAPSMHLQALDRLELKEDLVGAVARNELQLHYQPMIDLATGRTAGYEALVRWRHPTRGLLAPMSFIPLAEETALIVPIGRWVLETAVLQLKAWRSQGRDLTIAVNLSACQLDTEELPVELAALLRSTGSRPSWLTLELTESVAVGSQAALRLEALRALGVGVAVDDFGAGVASYASLQHFPFTAIKIDKSLIDGLTLPGRATAQIRSIVQMAHSSDLIVVAEGIEQPEQAAALIDLGCDLGQGYLFGRPVPPEETSEATSPGLQSSLEPEVAAT